MNVLKQIREKSPLIHAITNPISINSCANAALAVGASPIMAEHPKEVFGITKNSDCLLLNLGNITDIRMESMKISAECANLNRVPIVLDLVGVSCSELRYEFAMHLMEKRNLSVIKGNYSEIYSMYCKNYRSEGVDAEKSVDINMATVAVKSLALKFNVTVIASGAVDIIANCEKVIYIHNGTKMLSGITGTGCLLGMIVACCMSVDSSTDSAAFACAVLGICGELSGSEKGYGSFYTKLWDALSTVDDDMIEKYKKAEEWEF